jgi:acetylglutamate kinase
MRKKRIKNESSIRLSRISNQSYLAKYFLAGDQLISNTSYKTIGRHKRTKKKIIDRAITDDRIYIINSIACIYLHPRTPCRMKKRRRNNTILFSI